MIDQTVVGTQGSDVDMLAIVTLGEMLDDLELQRIANGNRIAALEREIGAAFPHLLELQRGLKQLEHETELELKRIWRKHPLAPWARETKGVGEKSIARLIAIVGDPSDRPNPAKLWQFCGHGDPNRRRFKGMTQEEARALGNPRAKKQVWLIATAMVKTRDSAYRGFYDEARERYTDRVHERACVRCGPSGQPAQPGTPWSLAHQHAAALRLVGKRFLLDLWKAAKEID